MDLPLPISAVILPIFLGTGFGFPSTKVGQYKLFGLTGMIFSTPKMIFGKKRKNRIMKFMNFQNLEKLKMSGLYIDSQPQ